MPSMSRSVSGRTRSLTALMVCEDSVIGFGYERTMPSGETIAMSSAMNFQEWRISSRSTVLRLLMRHNWRFIADDMAIVSPEGEVLSYPKPMTLSSHTMSAVNDRVLPLADRMMLGVRSRLHSREGRAVGHALGRRNIPIVTLNSWVQILIPPPKYHVTSLVECELADRARIDALVMMERGQPLAERAGEEFTIDRLLENTDDAYTFPPFASFAPMLVFNCVGYDALRVRERELLEAAMAEVWRVRVRVVGHEWAEIIPDLVERRRPELARRAAAIASAEVAPASVSAAVPAPDGEAVVAGLPGRSR